jgi:hypothetical protein
MIFENVVLVDRFILVYANIFEGHNNVNVNNYSCSILCHRYFASLSKN